MPKIIRLLIVQTVVGFGLGAMFVGMLLWFDVANLWYLVSNTDSGPFAAALLWVLNGSVFAAAQFGIALMRLAPDEDGRGGVPRHPARPMPARVGAEAGCRPARFGARG